MATVTLSPEDTLKLKESLKRCPEGTFEAAVEYRENSNPKLIPVIVSGIIERFLEPEAKPLLHSGKTDIRLFEDLGIDSLTMMEIVILVEETLNISFDNNELRELRTFEDIQAYMDSKATGSPTPKRAASLGFEEIASVLPQQPPFLFLNRATVGEETAKGEYRVDGGEFFLEGHFKNNPVVPASIMIEALGQLAVLFLLKSEGKQVPPSVFSETVFFKSCDGVRCHRICRPGDLFTMEVKLKRIRRPIAIFEGLITVGNEKAAFAEEIALAFDCAKEKPCEEPAAAKVNGSAHASVHSS
ncbi:phosphopantetheine-binding protein [Puniceicoccus vermicola]|uniref:FabA-like domain protein n=1 Tax=Puniceicoccus vermicola TaxID=388746 RepID=A0A7X1B0D8_9BACT|nr:FabA-like domain protein [Puniceicoccus vermicola]